MEDDELIGDARLRRELGYILDWTCRQRPAPPLPTRHVLKLKTLGFLNELGETTPEGLSFFDDG